MKNDNSEKETYEKGQFWQGRSEKGQCWKVKYEKRQICTGNIRKTKTLEKLKDAYEKENSGKGEPEKKLVWEKTNLVNDNSDKDNSGKGHLWKRNNLEKDCS